MLGEILFLPSCNVVFLIFPIYATFQSVINEAIVFLFIQIINNAKIISKLSD